MMKYRRFGGQEVPSLQEIERVVQEDQVAILLKGPRKVWEQRQKTLPQHLKGYESNRRFSWHKGAKVSVALGLLGTVLDVVELVILLVGANIAGPLPEVAWLGETVALVTTLSVLVLVDLLKVVRIFLSDTRIPEVDATSFRSKYYWKATSWHDWLTNCHPFKYAQVGLIALSLSGAFYEVVVATLFTCCSAMYVFHLMKKYPALYGGGSYKEGSLSAPEEDLLQENQLHGLVTSAWCYHNRLGLRILDDFCTNGRDRAFVDHSYLRPLWALGIASGLLEYTGIPNSIAAALLRTRAASLLTNAASVGVKLSLAVRFGLSGGLLEIIATGLPLLMETANAIVQSKNGVDRLGLVVSEGGPILYSDCTPSELTVAASMYKEGLDVPIVVRCGSSEASFRSGLAQARLFAEVTGDSFSCAAQLWGDEPNNGNMWLSIAPEEYTPFRLLGVSTDPESPLHADVHLAVVNDNRVFATTGGGDLSPMHEANLKDTPRAWLAMRFHNSVEVPSSTDLSP